MGNIFPFPFIPAQAHLQACLQLFNTFVKFLCEGNFNEVNVLKQITQACLHCSHPLTCISRDNFGCR